MNGLNIQDVRGRKWRFVLIAVIVCWWVCFAVIANLTGVKLTLLPPAADRDLQFLRKSRHLAHYLDDRSEPLISPQAIACEGHEAVPIVIMVSSSPHNVEQRATIRATWGTQLPTFFFIGRSGLGRINVDDQLVDNYLEAKQHSDLVVGDYIDTYDNLTLKSIHMLQWAARHCPHAEFVMKTDDDVIVNPWTLMEVLAENADADLIGYKSNTTRPHRDIENKWYLPYWLYPQPVIPEYLSGTGYIINGEHLNKMYEASFKVPLINLEDVYITYLVAKQHLSLRLTHEPRLSPYRPLLSNGCVYWDLASAHSLKPNEISKLWPKLRVLAEKFEEDEEPCKLHNMFLGFLSWRTLLLG